MWMELYAELKLQFRTEFIHVNVFVATIKCSSRIFFRIINFINCQLTLSWRKFLLYRKQSIDLQSK